MNVGGPKSREETPKEGTASRQPAACLTYGAGPRRTSVKSRSAKGESLRRRSGATLFGNRNRRAGQVIRPHFGTISRDRDTDNRARRDHNVSPSRTERGARAGRPVRRRFAAGNEHRSGGRRSTVAPAGQRGRSGGARQEQGPGAMRHAPCPAKRKRGGPWDHPFCIAPLTPVKRRDGGLLGAPAVSLFDSDQSETFFVQPSPWRRHARRFHMARPRLRAFRAGGLVANTSRPTAPPPNIPAVPGTDRSGGDA